MSTKTTLQTVAASLNSLSSQDLILLNKQLIQIVKQRQNIEKMKASISFCVGDKVSWFSPRNHRNMTGEVKKVKRVNILVSTEQGLWNVSANLLKKV